MKNFPPNLKSSRKAGRNPKGPAGGNAFSSLRTLRAFSLVEILIAVSLMGFMILGLMAMFGHTQRAFRVGMAQTDVLETGRATMGLLAGEFECATASGLGGVTNFAVYYYDNFYSTNALPGTTGVRTNVLEQAFFLVRENQKWHGIGYLVAAPNQAMTNAKVGTLYRFQTPWSREGTNNPSSLAYNFLRVANNAIFNWKDLVREKDNNTNLSTNLHRVADGVIHFRVQAGNRTNGLIEPSTIPPNWTNNIAARTNWLPPAEISYVFTSNAVPAYVDLELGILESAVWERMKSIPNDDTRHRYLQRQAARIHLFRRQATVHNVEPEAYR